jgi:hypothetical protein
MARRLTTNQEILGSIPSVFIFWFFVLALLDKYTVCRVSFFFFLSSL